MRDKEIKMEARKRILNGITVKNGCWIWNGSPRKNGYCRSSFMGKSWYIHRLSFYAFKTTPKEKMDICHKCDVRACCNPSHLFQGTRAENMRDAVKKGRHAKGQMLPQTKLSDECKKQIMKLVHSGYFYKDIAKKFDVTRHRIGQIAIENGVRRHVIS